MEPAAIRYKNPSAMWPGPVATKWGSLRWVYLSDGTGQGGNGKGNKIAIFDTWVQGICAQLDLWRTSPRYRNKTLREAITTWSGGNNVPSYLKFLKARIPGLTDQTVMNDAFWNGPNGLAFLKAQSGHEAGKTIPAPPEDWVRAQSIVFGKAPPVAPQKIVIPTVATGVAAEITHQAGFSGAWIALAGVVVLAGFIAWTVFQNYRKLKALDEQSAALENAIHPGPVAPPPEAPIEPV